MENISKAVVIVELLSDVWVVMDNGDWVKVDSIPEQFADLPVLNSSDIALEGNELVFSEASEQLVVPQDIISQLVSDLSQNSTFDARSNTSSVTSLSSSDANEAQVAYQLIARQGQELVPESGYETTPTETTEEEDPNFIEFRPDPIFTVGQLGGDGVFINKYDAVALEFSGTVENVPDGSLVQIVLSDSDGNEIIVTTEVQDGVWSVTNIDITALNDGEVTATVSLVGGNEDDAASETKVKDTQADIFIDFEDGLNTNQPIDFEGEVQDVQDGQLVTVTIFDAQGNPITTYEATVTNGQWSVGPEPFADLPDGNYTIQVSTIDEAGNDTQTQKSFSKDTTAIITIDVNETEDGVINNSENVVQVSGTVEGIEDGQTVLVTLTDIDGNEVSVEAVVENGQYQLEVDISSLSDGEITATAQAQDLLGNESTASQVISHDKTAQLTVEIDSTQDGVINSEEESNVTVRGVVTGIEDGQTVTVVLSDGVNPPITLTAIVVNGSYEIAGVDISSLNDGTISANATAQDISGNPASASDEAQYDSSVATSIVAQDIDGVINSAEQNNVQLSGSVTDIEPGQLVTVTFTDSNNQQVVVTAEVDADGNWQISGDIESLADGEISAQISIFDAAGNEATQEVTFAKDTQSTLTLNIDKTEDGVINGSAENTDISLSGIVNGVEDGQEVTIIFTDSVGNEVVVTAIVENGNYALSGVDISALNDGDISVSASVLDTAGNTAVAEDSFEIDNSALITASIDKTDDGVINGQDDDLRDNVNTAENAGVVVRGTVEDVEDGQIVTVTLSDGINPPVITQAVVQNGQYVTEPMDATGLNDGTMIATAEVADAAGNPISAQDNVEIDTTAAITTSIDKTADSVINGSNENQEIVVRGTVSGIEDGQVVTITLRDGVNPDIAVQAIVQNGEYVTAPIDASSLNDGDIVARADVSDLAGNEATARDTVEIDKLADITTNIDKTADGVINGSGESAAIVVRGTVEDVEDGQIVTVTISDGVNPAVTTTATVINGEYVTTPIDASSLNDGTLTATASVSDIAGNPVSAQDSVELDNTAAITTSIDKTADGVINGNGESAAIVVRGTVSDVEDGQTVTVTISDGVNPPVEVQAIVENGEYVTTPIDASSLNDGTLTATATASDLAGNPVSAQDSVELDNTAAIITSIDKTADGVINDNGESAAIVVRGTVSDVEDGQTVTVIISDGTNQVETTALVQIGEYVTDPIDASALNDGTLTATASVSDVAGNPISAQDAVELDNTAVITTSIDKTADGVINGNGESAAMVIRGTVTDVEDGQTVTITLSDGINAPIEVQATVQNGEYVTDPIDASALNDGTLTATASVSDVAGNPVNAQDSVELDNTAVITTSIDKTADGVINGNGESAAMVIRGTVTDVEDGQTVTVIISDGTNQVETTALVQNGEYVTDPIDASALNDGTLTATASVSDLAGNPVNAQDSVELDNTAALTTSIDKTADGVINGNGESAAMVVRGTVSDVEDGQTVTVIIGDGTNQVETTALVQNGEYVTDPIDASALNDGTLTATASVSDVAGNPISAQDAVELDNTAVITTSIDKTADGVINGNGESAAMVIRGTVTDVEDGQTVTITLSDGINAPIEVQATVQNGEYVTDPIDASALNDGTLTATASVSDVAGNPVTAEDTVELDNTAAITTSIDKTADGVINGNGESAAMVVRGTVTDVEDGQTVTVIISDGTNQVETTALVQNGEYVTDPIDASALNDGTLTATASVSDVAGNPVNAQDSVELDNTAAITTSIDKTADGVINGNGESAAMVVRGTVSDVEDGQTVTVIIGDGTNQVETTALVQNGEYVTDPIDASALNDGTLTATASVSDVAGNPISAQDAVELDNTAVITTSIDKTADGVINGNGESAAMVIRGTVTDVEDGQTVTITLSDGINAPIEVQATVQNGEYVTDPIDASALNDGTLTATASVSDVAGNPVNAQDSVELDNTAVITTSIDKTADGVINGNGESAAMVIRGTVTDVEDGQTVTVIISDGTNQVETTALVQNGEYVTDPIDASALNDGTLTATASVSDVAGNPVNAQDSVELDNTAAITTSIDKTADGVINGNGESAAMVVRGTVSDVEDGQTVTVIISDGTNQVETTALVQNGEYVTDPIDASALNDGTLTATASVSDVAGNPISAQDAVELDNTAVITTSIDKTADGVINGNGESAAMVIRGTVTDVEDGQTVTITLSDGINAPIEVQATVQNGEYVTDPIDASALNDGTLTATASVSDVAGNPVTAEGTVELDNTAAITTSIDKTADGVINGNGESAAMVVRGTVTDVEDGQTVTVIISDGTNQVETTALVQNGEYVTDPIDASALNDGTLTATASVSDVAGNPVNAQDSVELDNTAAITTSIDKTADGVINGNGESAAMVVRGTVSDVEDGQTVTVIIGDGTNQVETTALVQNGEYVTDPIDASALNDGTLTATASVSDVAGNPISAQDAVELDNTAVITTSIDKTADGVINGNGESAAMVIRGTVTDVEDGQTVTITLSDGINAPIEVQATVQNGEYVTDPIDASALNDGTLTATASVSDVAGNPVNAQDSVELDNTAVITTSIDKTADGVINGNGESAAMVIRGTVTDVEDGQTVTVIISDGTNQVETTALVQNGEYVTDPIDASALNDGTLTATASVSDVAGNPVNAQDSVELDNTAAITTSIDKTADGVINGNGESAAMVVRGTVSDVEDGQTVTVIISDGTNQVETTALVQNGEYVTDPIDASALNDGTLTATASVSDVAGNPISAQDAVELDNTAVITTSIDKTADGVINGNGESAAMVIRGTVTDVEDGQTVTITLSDGINAPIEVQATVQNDEYVTDPIDASALNDGTLTATASVSDVAGNPVTAEGTVELDNTAAITTSIDKTADGVINGNGESAAMVVRGTVTDVEDGQTVTVIISDGTNQVETTALVQNGEYVTDPIDASALNDGTLTATASVSDVAGNPVNAQDSVELDNTAAITTSIDKTADGVINGNGESAAMVVRGTVSDVEDGQTVTVIISDGTNQVETTALVQNGEYVTDPIDASALNDGTLTATASVSDVAGNPISAQDAVELDNTAVITTSIDKTADGVINGNGESAAMVIRGTVTDVEDGQTVTITLSDGINAPIEVQATVQNGEYVTDPIDASALNDGTLTATASVSDVAGNPVTAEDTVELDNTAAITTSIDKTADGVINGNGESAAMVVRGTVTDVEDGQTVTVIISDGTNQVETTALVQNGEYVTDPIDASALNDGTLTATASVSDVAGNPVNAQDSVELDNTAAITTSIDKTADGVINGNGESAAMVVRGTVSDVEDGQTVTVIISDGTNQVETTALVQNGEYVTDPIDASALNDGTLTATASVSDVAGNPISAQDAVELDNTAVITTSIDKTADGVINGNGESAAMVVRGTVTDVEDGQTVTVIISDGTNQVETTALVQNGEYVTDPIDASSLDDGTLSATATVSDIAGNNATDTDTVTHDKTAVTSIDVATGDDAFINTAEQENVVVSGVIEEADTSQTATVVFTDVNGDKVTVENVAIDADGEWQIAATDISTLADGEITASVSALDVEGNLATNETSFTKDTTVAVTVDINDTSDNVINGNGENTNVEITGTTTGVEDNQTVTVVVKDAAGNERSFEATVINNAYTIIGADLSGLDDGTLTATATVSDVAGNTATDTDTAIHDKTAATTIEMAAGDDVVNTDEQGNVVVSGVIEEADENQTATVVFTDVNGDKVTVENVVINAAGEWSINATDISELADGEITAEVSALDIEGNLATNSTTFTKDTTINIDIDTGESGINSRSFKDGEVTTLNGTTDAEPGSIVTLTIFDGTTSEIVTAAVANGGTWTVNGIDVSELDDTQSWTITATVTDSAGNTAQDIAPTLDALDSQTLNESNTASGGTSSATSSIEIDNADLTLSTNQSGLEGLTVDGNPVTVTLANDGLSLEVKDSQGNLVLSVALAGGELTTTLHAPIDHESESLLTDIFVDALQTDADGTTELVVVPTSVTITDSAPQSSDDSFSVTEADTDAGRVSTGSLVINDSVVEGEPTVTSVTFNGTDYDDITADTPAIIVTDEGTLTVNSDGTWSFNALDNRDSTPSPQFTIEYTIADRDGVGSSTSTATFTVQDGSAGSFTNQATTYTESDYGVITTNNKSFDVVAGSDALVADSITFDDTIASLDSLNLTSSGSAITFVLSEDGKTITGSANGSEVIRFSVSATQDANGKDLDAKVQTTVSLPLDNPNGENIDFALSINGEDSDGTAISGAGNVTITVQDGGGPQVEDTSETPISIDESGLDPANNTTVSQQGTVSTTVGSDTITSLAFSSDSQPNLTAGGVALVYTLSDDGRTITANTGEGTETIFVATLPDINGTSNQNLTYEFTLYRPFDNTIEGTGVPLQVEVIDNDGDSNTTTLNITVNDGGAEHTQNDITLNVSETPNSVADNNEDGDGQANTDTDTSFTVTAGLDDVVDMQVSITDGAAVLDSNGNQLTQTTLDENGNAVTTNIVWQVNSDGTAQGILEGTSTEVFKITLPDVNVDAQTSATYAISFEISGAIDHTGDTTDAPQIVIPVYTEDTDGSQVTSNVTVTLNDGTDPVIANSATSVDEANLRGNDSITATGQISVTQGSDEIIEIKLVDDFITTFNNEGYVTADGNNAITLNDKNADGWYIATANGEDVLRVKFNPDGSYTYEQFTAIEHPDANGANTKDISFDVTAVDADGDTNNASVTISITDDTPTIDANPVEVNLVEGQSTTIDLLDTNSNDFVGNDNNPGADGAKLSSFNYGGTEYTAFDSGSDTNGSYKEVALQDENGNDTQGTLRVYESGKVVFDTSAFDQTASVDFNEQITYNVIDNDGDEVTGSIIELTTSDAEGSMSVTAQNIREDATDDNGIVNSARSQITISIDRGDIDQNETVSEIRIEVASLQGGELYLNDALATDNANVSIVDGYYVFTGDTITINADDTVTISDLFFQPAQNSSDETQSVTVNIEATIGIGSASRELSASDTIAVESVADTPDWDGTNDYSYTTAEDTEATINIGASLQDTDGSETLTYIINNIQEGLIVSADGRELSNGDEITAAEAQSLTAIGEEHVAGTFTFDITAVATEAENDDSASSITREVEVKITPVADEPRLFVRNQTVDEDTLTPAIDLFSGLLVDEDGSETLRFEVELPEGFELVDENGNVLTQDTDGNWLVSDTELQAGNIFLKQKEDASRATDATFDITVTAIATETSTGEEARTQPDTLQLTVIGKIDPPELDEENSNDNWAFAEVDENNFTLQNTQGTEDTNLRLDFLIVTSDVDQSEAISLVISDLPDSVMLVDVNGDPADLPIVGTDANGKPMYSLTAAEMENYYLAPVDDFSGEVNFNIKVVPTEADGDTNDYNIAVTTNFNPTIDNNTQSLATTSEGNEDTRIALNFNPDLIDSDGSETITGAVITGIPANTTLYVDGNEVSVGSGYDLADLINDEYPTLEDVLASDRVRLLPDEDFSGTLTVDVLYTVTDTSDVGSVSEDISSQVTVTVNGQVDTQSSAERDNSGAVTRLEATDETITSSSRTMSLSGAVSFTEEDIDGSEVITHIEIILPDGVNIEVLHPNGAYPDGSGRWIIPIDAGTSDTVQDVISDLLADVTLEAQNSTGDIDVTVKARVADGSHAVLLSDNFTVNFSVTGEGSSSEASEVGQLQISVVDAVEDEVVDFTGHINTSLTDDENDTVTVYISADSLPEGLIIEGDGVIAIPGDDGEVAEYIIPEESLGNLSFTSAGDDYSGQLIIPVTIIAVDDDSGDEYIDDTQSLEIDVTPVADGGEFSAAINKIKEDNRTTALGLTLALTDLNQVDDDSNPQQNGGVEEVDFSQPITITLPDGVGLYDPNNMFTDNGDNTYTYNGTEAEFAAALAGIGVEPIEDQSGTDIDIQITATIVDTAQLSTGTATATTQVTNTISIAVEAVTDEAVLAVADAQGSEDADIALAGLSALLKDDDGSETISITISGVPKDAVLKDADGNLLVNNGKDGGTFNGEDTTSWTVTAEQLAGLIIVPPLDFSGEFELTLNALTQDESPGEIVQTSASFMVVVNPEADALDFSKQPFESYDGQEDDTITIDLEAFSEEADGSETIQLTVNIAADSDSSALEYIDGEAFITIGSETVFFTSDGNGGFSATITSDSSSIENFDFNAGGLAFGTLNMSVDVATVDSAEINGETVTSVGDTQSSEFIIELEPQADAPVWTAANDVTSNSTNNIALNLDADLQNPAADETGYIEITGLPDGYSFNFGEKVGDTWTVDIADIEALEIIDADAGDSFTLTLNAFSTLNGETQQAPTEEVDVTISASASNTSSSSGAQAQSYSEGSSGSDTAFAQSMNESLDGDQNV